MKDAIKNCKEAIEKLDSLETRSQIRLLAIGECKTKSFKAMRAISKKEGVQYELETDSFRRHFKEEKTRAAHIIQLRNKKDNLQICINQIEEQMITLETLRSLEMASSTMKHNKVDIDKIETTMQSIQDFIDDAKDITTSITNFNEVNNEVSEEDLLAEMEALESSMTQENQEIVISTQPSKIVKLNPVDLKPFNTLILATPLETSIPSKKIVEL